MTRAGVSRVRFHRSEDASFYTLLLLGVLVSGGLLALVIRLWPLYVHELMNLCFRSWDVLMAHIRSAGAVPPLFALVSILGTGTLGFLRRVRATHRFARLLSVNRIATPDALLPLFEDLNVAEHIDIVEDTTTYVFCYGLLSPRICISTGVVALLDDAELRMLLLHERYHLRRHHPLRSFLADTVARALALIPIASDLRRSYRIAQEVAADTAAIETYGAKQPLASALLKLLESDSGAHYQPRTAVGALSATEVRILHLLHDSPDGIPGTSVNWRATVIPSAFVIGGLLVAGFAAYTSLSMGFAVECMNPLFG